MNRLHLGAASVLALSLAACTSAPPAVPPAPPVDRVAIIAAIHHAGAADERELVVRTLVDPALAGMQDDAARLQAEGRDADAAELLDRALDVHPQDPGLLQARAESAVMLGDLAAAEHYARRAAAAGTQVGPQCRRHWETVVQVLAAQQPAEGDIPADATALDEAAARRQACTVAAPVRY